MPANFQPIFILTPNLASCTISAANTARDGSGVLVGAFTAGTNGSRIDYITFTSSQSGQTSASAARVCRVFITDSNGANPKLRSEVVLAAVTPSATAIGSTSTITYNNGLLLKSGQLLRVTQSVYTAPNDGTDVFVHGGDY